VGRVKHYNSSLPRLLGACLTPSEMLRVKILALGTSTARKTLSYLNESLGMKVVTDLPIMKSTFVGDEWISGSVKIGEHCEIEVIESSRINTARKYAGKPDMLRLVSVDVTDPDSSTSVPSHPDSLFSNSELLRLCLGNSTRLLPKLTLSQNNFSNQSRAVEDAVEDIPLRVKELVLGTLDDDDACHEMNQQLYYNPNVFPVSPSVWRVGEVSSTKPAIRILPSIVSSIILYCPSFEKMIGQGEDQLQHSKIGYRGLQKGQLMLNLPVPGIDLRLCEQEEIEQSFNECSEALMKDVLKGIGDVQHTESEHCGTVVRKEMIGLAMKDKL